MYNMVAPLFCCNLAVAKHEPSVLVSFVTYITSLSASLPPNTPPAPPPITRCLLYLVPSQVIVPDSPGASVAMATVNTFSPPGGPPIAQYSLAPRPLPLTFYPYQYSRWWRWHSVFFCISWSTPVMVLLPSSGLFWENIESLWNQVWILWLQPDHFFG